MGRRINGQWRDPRTVRVRNTGITLGRATNMGQRLSPLHQEIVSLLPWLRAVARSLTHNPTEADDLVQETLMKAIASIEQFSPGTNLRAWLCTIQRNTFYTKYHKNAREPLLMVEELPGFTPRPRRNGR